MYYDKRGALRKERVELAERVWSEDKDIENKEQQPPCISELSRAEYLSDSSQVLLRWNSWLYYSSLYYSK